MTSTDRLDRARYLRHPADQVVLNTEELVAYSDQAFNQPVTLVTYLKISLTFVLVPMAAVTNGDRCRASPSDVPGEACLLPQGAWVWSSAQLLTPASIFLLSPSWEKSWPEFLDSWPSSVFNASNSWLQLSQLAAGCSFLSTLLPLSSPIIDHCTERRVGIIFTDWPPWFHFQLYLPFPLES